MERKTTAIKPRAGKSSACALYMARQQNNDPIPLSGARSKSWQPLKRYPIVRERKIYSVRAVAGFGTTN